MSLKSRLKTVEKELENLRSIPINMRLGLTPKIILMKALHSVTKNVWTPIFIFMLLATMSCMSSFAIPRREGKEPAEDTTGESASLDGSVTIRGSEDLYYGDDDISEYVDAFLKNSPIPRNDKFKYLINVGGGGGDVVPIHDEGDGNDYFVAVSPAIDTHGLGHTRALSAGSSVSSVNLEYFLDKSSHPADQKEVILEKLLKFKPELKNPYGELLAMIEELKRGRLNLEFVYDILAGKGDDVGKILEGFEQELAKIKKDKKDVFDELMTYFLDPATKDKHAKVLFPYNKTQFHWLTGEIRIHKRENVYKVEVHAHDPYGAGKMDDGNFTKLEAAIRKRIQEFDPAARIEHIQNLGSPYVSRQNDGISCGVIVAEDLVRRVTGRGLECPSSVLELRKAHLEAVRRSDPVSKFIGRNQPKITYLEEKGGLPPKMSQDDTEEENFGISVAIEQTAESKKEKKEKDLEKLFEIYEILKQFRGDSVEEALDTLGGVGARARLINYDMSDKECIRNKYSTVDAFGNGREPRANGINFIEFKHLGDLIERKLLKGEEVSSCLEKIKSDLATTVNKILFVFFQEREKIAKDSALAKKLEEICAANKQPAGLGEELPNIPKLARLHYDKLVMRSILEELKLFEEAHLDFSRREDRYYWGRILVKVGELLHPDELSDSYRLSETFKPITKLRSQLIHAHRMLISIDAKYQLEFYRHAKVTFDSLRSIIKQLEKSEELDSKAKDELEKNARIFLKFFDKPEGSSTAEVEQTEQKKDKPTNASSLERCIVRAGIYLEKLKEPKKLGRQADKKKGPESLESLDNEYQVLLKGTSLPEGYPKKLDKDSEENILRLAENIKKQSKEKKEKSIPATVKQDELSNDEKITKLLDKIMKEIDYIREVGASPSIPGNRKPYIIQHAETVIGEYMREIKKEVSSSKTPTLIEKGSVTWGEANRTAIFQRSKGLGHEPLSLDHNVMMQGLHDDILPSYQDHKAIYIVGQNSIRAVPQTAIIFNRVGRALLRLCLYKEAVDFFRRALQDIESSPKLPNISCLRTKIDQYKLDAMGITQPTAIVIDMPKELFGIDSYALAFTHNLMFALLLAGDLEGVCKLARQFFDKVSLDRLAQYKKTIILGSVMERFGGGRSLETLGIIDPQLLETYKSIIKQIESIAAPFVIMYPEDSEVFNQFSGISANAASAYYLQGKFQEARKFYEQALEFSGSKDNVVGISLALIQCCYRLGKDDEVVEMYINLVVKDGDLLDQFSVGVLKCNMWLDKGDPKNFSKIELEIKSLEKMLDEHKGEFKEALGDEFLARQLTLRELKLYLCSRRKSDYSEINDEIMEGLKVVKKLMRGNRFFSEVLNFYCYASRALSNIAPPSEAILREAESYLENAEKMVLGTSSLLSVREAAKDLAVVYSNVAMLEPSLSYVKRIKYLERAQKIQEKYSIKTDTTRANLAYTHFNHADKLYDEKKHKEAILYYREAIKILESIQYKEDPETLRSLALCYEGLGDCLKNRDYWVKARDLSFEFIRRYPKHEYCSLVRSFAKDVIKKIGT